MRRVLIQLIISIQETLPPLTSDNLFVVCYDLLFVGLTKAITSFSFISSLCDTMTFGSRFFLPVLCGLKTIKCDSKFFGNFHCEVKSSFQHFLKT